MQVFGPKMEVRAISGTLVTKIDEEDLRGMVAGKKPIRSLKHLLAAQIGCSRFQQRLLTEDCELQDEMLVKQFPHVQLVILDFCAPDETMQEELLLACQQNRVGEVEELLQKPLNPNRIVSHTDRTLLIHVAADNGHSEIVRLLLEARADKNATTSTGATAMFVAAQNGHWQVVRLLLAAGADTNATIKDGTTALLKASERGHFDLVDLLLGAGATEDAAKAAAGVALGNGHGTVFTLCMRFAQLKAKPDLAGTKMQSSAVMAAYVGSEGVHRPSLLCSISTSTE